MSYLKYQHKMTRNEQEYYKNIARIARSLEDIVITLEKMVNEKKTNIED